MVCFFSIFYFGEMLLKKPFNFKVACLKPLVLAVVCSLYSWHALSAPPTVIKVSSLQIAPAGFIENNIPQGIFYDIAKQVILEAGYTPSIQIFPYPRVVDNLITGKADMSILMENATIEKTCDAIAPILKVESIIVGLKGNNFPDLLSLHGKTVGVVRLAKYHSEFDQDLKIDKYEVNSYEQGLNMLISKRFDAVVGTKISLYYTLARQGYSAEILDTPLVLNSKIVSIQYSKESANPQAKNKIAQAVRKLIKQGEINKIIESYIGLPQSN